MAGCPTFWFPWQMAGERNLAGRRTGAEGKPAPAEWPRTAAALEAEQIRLADLAPRPHAFDGSETIGACFACFDENDRGFAGAAVLDRNLRPLAIRTSRQPPLGHPYQPGLLALREGALLTTVVTQLDPRPGLLVVNATGRDHPRRAGLALHLGYLLDLPTVGVTHRSLLGPADPPLQWHAAPRGTTAPVVVDGEELAAWVVTVAGRRPLVAHPGWRTDLATASAVLLATTRSARTPEPLRWARRAARLERARG